jgi:hypothetical protein
MTIVPTILNTFIRLDVVQLREIQKNNFNLTITGQGGLIKSTVNGNTFEFHAPDLMSSQEIVIYAELALNHKMKGICRPITRTTARFV